MTSHQSRTFLFSPFCLLKLAALLVLLLPLDATATSVADTDIEGNVIWRLMSSPILVTVGIQVTPGSTLTIEPGVTIRFRDSNGRLTMNGVLIAEGTKDRPITFTSDEAAKQKGQWENLRFETLESSASRLSYCLIEAGGNNQSYMSKPGLIYCVNRATPQISKCTIRQSATYGMVFVNASPTLTDNSISDCEHDAILLENTEDGASYPTYNGVNTFGAGDYVRITGDFTSTGALRNPGQSYLVVSRPEVRAGVLVSIDQGVTIQFRDDNGHLKVSGVLHANGTSDQPITFTSDEAVKDKGQWENLRFETMESSMSHLTHCLIEAGGTIAWYMSEPGLIYCLNQANPEISNCTIRQSATYGMVLSNASPTLSDNSISDCERDAILLENTEDGASYPTYSGTNIYGAGDFVRVTGDFISSGTLRNPGQAYLIMGRPAVPTGVTLTIEPGVIIQFYDDNGHLKINGVLHANGTNSQPITFTSDETVKEKGQWENLRFETVESSASHLTHCLIEAGGTIAWYMSKPGLIYCVDLANPQISNCTIRESATYGMVLANASPTLTDNFISDCEHGAILLQNTGDGASYPTYSGTNTYGQEDYVRITGEFTSSGTLRNPGKAYIMMGRITVPVGVTLTIEPGATIQFCDDNGHLKVNGVLLADGAPGKPITFSSEEQTKEKAQWENLRFETAESSGSRLSYCIIEAGGNNARYMSKPGLVYCADGAAPEMFRCTLRMSHTDGIRCDAGASPVVRNCSITDVNWWGLLNTDPTTLVDARQNWWGDASGPLDDSDALDLAQLYNPDGLGCKASDDVDYSDWLDNPPILTLTIVRDGSTVWLTWSAFDDGQYTVQWTRDLVSGTWQNASGSWPITDTFWAGEDITGITKRFYRLMFE